MLGHVDISNYCSEGRAFQKAKHNLETYQIESDVCSVIKMSVKHWLL